MRIPIAVQVQPFNIETAQPRIDAIRAAFVRYLEKVPRKSTRSKYGLMGPVGKILAEVKSGRRDPTSLKGYAVRVHEQLAGYPSHASLEALEQGIDGLIKLLGESPVTAHDQIIDRLDYGLYYDLRKMAMAAKEARKQVWITFLRDKYGTEARLSEAWGEDVGSFDELYLPRKAEGRKGKRATLRQRDIVEFWESQGVAIAEEEE